jgi:hypothetical protein
MKPADTEAIMKRVILAALFAGTVSLAAPGVALAGPQNNSDGSQTCNSTQPPNTSSSDGGCAGTIERNESYCDGGMSSEPGGGVTCSPGPNSSQASTSQPRKTSRTLKN